MAVMWLRRATQTQTFPFFLPAVSLAAIKVSHRECVSLFFLSRSLFVDDTKLTPLARKQLLLDTPVNLQPPGLSIDLRPYKMVKDFLKWLVSQEPGKIWVRVESCRAELVRRVSRTFIKLEPGFAQPANWPFAERANIFMALPIMANVVAQSRVSRLCDPCFPLSRE